MRFTLAVSALAMAGTLLSAAARADDPSDSTMHAPAARAADHDAIARLNRDQLAYVQQRDAGYAQGWHTTPRDDTAYADARAQYARQLASWRAQVAACRAGAWSACQQ